jgi:hypothetical protein
VNSKLGRPLGRPRSRASFLGHPGPSPQRRRPAFLLPPVPPPPRTALGCGGLLTLTLRGKAMDGFEDQQGRNRPQLSPPSLGNRRTDAGFPQASTGRRRSVAGRSLGLSLSQRTEHTIDRSQTLATQSTRPPNRGRLRVSWDPLPTQPHAIHPATGLLDAYTRSRMRVPSCPRCGYRESQLSRRKPLLPLWLLGFRYFRCPNCVRRFLRWRPWAVPPAG